MEEKPFYKKIPWWGWLLIILFTPGILMSLFSAGKSKPVSEPTKQEEVKKENKQTQASVNFTGTQFVITNRNDFDWNRVDILFLSPQDAQKSFFGHFFILFCGNCIPNVTG